MTAHRFRIGENVYYRPATHGLGAPRGFYQIVKFLPRRYNYELEYLIQSLEDTNEQVAEEKELRPA
jgi:hypothetical protein